MIDENMARTDLDCRGEKINHGDHEAHGVPKARDLICLAISVFSVVRMIQLRGSLTYEEAIAARCLVHLWLIARRAERNDGDL